jgi:hypothetical protein
MRLTAVLNQTLNKVQLDRPQVNDRNLHYTGLQQTDGDRTDYAGNLLARSQTFFLPLLSCEGAVTNQKPLPVTGNADSGS